MKKLLIYSLLSVCTANTFAQIQESNIRKHIGVLASDSLMGRGTGTSGERMAASYIESQFKKLKLKPKGDNKTYFQSFPFKAGVHGTGRQGTARNIVAYIDNKATNTIIIGAHYDHLGLGLDGNSLDANAQDKIHNGADDNASGVAGVLELARYFQNNKIKEKNNFLFLCFSGEELGLFGSKYYTEHVTIDTTRINFMINLDMIGRLNATTREVSVSGTGTSKEWEPAIKSLGTDALVMKTDSSGMGPSDHSSFYMRGIPAIHFFTGSHNDYHKPSDDSDKINYEGEVKVLDHIIKLVDQLDSKPKFAFLTTKTKSIGGSRAFKVTLGIMPSYTSDVEGLKVDGVTEGKPAYKAGILAGDVIVQMGELMIKDIGNYMEALGKFEKGQTIPVKVQRGKEVITLNVTL